MEEVALTNRPHLNRIHRFSKALLRSERARCDGILASDARALASGNAFYLENLLAEPLDFSIMQRLVMELQEFAPEKSGMVKWSQHLKFENPEFSPTFHAVVQAMADFFDVEVLASRLNFYADGSSWKPFHHDSHAFANDKKEDFTMGASFGAERKLSFLHPPSRQTFEFPQKNGDVFAFTSIANQKFQHGVPKLRAGDKAGPRFSIIAWGRRRTLNERNSPLQSQGRQDYKSDGPRRVERLAETKNAQEKETRKSTENVEDSEQNEVEMTVQQVAEMVEKMILESKPQIDKTSSSKAEGPKSRFSGSSRRRIQTGWNS